MPCTCYATHVQVCTAHALHMQVCTGVSIGKARLVTVGNPAAVWDAQTQTVRLAPSSNLP